MSPDVSGDFCLANLNQLTFIKLFRFIIFGAFLFTLVSAKPRSGQIKLLNAF